ncbi:MAG: tetratricopeptide repeat protein [Lachnospiraceae bacterium]|nr:tetratricopeptide repeat protein [Lachnospiraceae bacterium]
MNNNDRKKSLLIFVLSGLILVGGLIFAISIKIDFSRKESQNLQLDRLYLDEMNYEMAIAVFKKVIEIDPQNVKAYEGIANVYVYLADDAINQNDIDAAIAYYDAAITVLIDGENSTGDKELDDFRRIIEEKKKNIEETKRGSNNADIAAGESDMLTDGLPESIVDEKNEENRQDNDYVELAGNEENKTKTEVIAEEDYIGEEIPEDILHDNGIDVFLNTDSTNHTDFLLENFYIETVCKHGNYQDHNGLNSASEYTYCFTNDNWAKYQQASDFYNNCASQFNAANNAYYMILIATAEDDRRQYLDTFQQNGGILSATGEPLEPKQAGIIINTSTYSVNQVNAVIQKLQEAYSGL